MLVVAPHLTKKEDKARMPWREFSGGKSKYFSYKEPTAFAVTQQLPVGGGPDMAARKVRRATSGRQKTVDTVHSVKAALQVPGLSKAGSSLTLHIYARDEKIGEIELGRGSLFWRGGKRQKRKRIGWSRFAEMMDDLAYG